MIRHLPFFVAVAEEGNFQRASRRLNIAQSALSRRIRDLEHDLGDVPLFVRMPTGVQLTPSGAAFLTEARAILGQLEDARQRAAAIMRGEEGVLRIGYSVGAVRSPFIGDLFRAFRGAFPRVSLRAELLPVEDLLDRLRRSQVEAAIFYTNSPGPDFQSILIAHERFQLAVPAGHRLAKAPQLRFADLIDEDFVWYARLFSPTVHHRMLAEFLRRGAEPKITMESPTSDTTMKLVAAGFGLGFVAPAPSSPLPAGVVLRTVEDFELDWEFRMVWLTCNPSPILPRLIAAVAAAVGCSTAQTT